MDLQDKQKVAIQNFVSANTTGLEFHPQRIASSNWWHLFKADGSFPCLMSLLLLKLDVRLLGDVSICPGIKFAELPQIFEENGGHSRSYQFQENMTVVSGMAFLIITWRMSFRNVTRVPLPSTVPNDIHDTLGGARNVMDLCKAEFLSLREMVLPRTRS